MKVLRRANSKMLVMLTTLLLAIVTLFAGANVAQAPKASAETTGMTYIDTEVESIRSFQGDKNVILAFCLTVSDYDDFDPVKDFNSENPAFGEGTAKYNYITSLSYWKNFKNMNSAGVYFNQTFAYWNGGFGDSQIASVGYNAVAHLTTLERAEYGFMIRFPAGTEFPSWEYTQTGCKSEPKVYRTTTDAAFYYNGSSFEKIDYRVAEERDNAIAQVSAVDMSLYYAAEQTLVTDLIATAKNEINQCFNLSDIQVAVNDFNTALKEIKTVEDYAKLNEEKGKVKVEMETYFEAFAESAYGQAEWQLISSIKAETNALIDAAESMTQVAQVVAGIQYKVEEILTEAEKPAFAEFVAEAIQNVKNAFVASLYRDAEVEMANWLIGNAEKELEAATTYGEVEAIELAYLADIAALKTAAEWEAEEALIPKDEPIEPQPEEPEVEAPDSVVEPASGCGSSVVETLVVISMALAFTLVVMMKKRKI